MPTTLPTGVGGLAGGITSEIFGGRFGEDFDIIIEFNNGKVFQKALNGKSQNKLLEQKENASNANNPSTNITLCNQLYEERRIIETQ